MIPVSTTLATANKSKNPEPTAHYSLGFGFLFVVPESFPQGCRLNKTLAYGCFLFLLAFLLLRSEEFLPVRLSPINIFEVVFPREMPGC
jgi:hypothetical protein